MYDIDLISKVSTSDGIGGTDTTLTSVGTFKGLIDMLGKSNKEVANQFTVESTHICLTYVSIFDMNNRGDRLELDGLQYEIMYVDKPLHFIGKKYHVEIYLKVLGD